MHTWVQKQGKGLTRFIKSCAYLTRQGLEATVGVSVGYLQTFFFSLANLFFSNESLTTELSLPDLAEVFGEGTNNLF